MDDNRREALTFVLTFARPPDLSVSEDEDAWRRFDAGARGGGGIEPMEQLARELGLVEQVDREEERLGRGPEGNTFEQRVQDLYDDVSRIFGLPGDVSASISSEGWPELWVGDDLHYTRPHDKGWFTRYRRIDADRVEATLWNRAGTKPLDQKVLDLPDWWRES